MKRVFTFKVGGKIVVGVNGKHIPSSLSIVWALLRVNETVHLEFQTFPPESLKVKSREGKRREFFLKKE